MSSSIVDYLLNGCSIHPSNCFIQNMHVIGYISRLQSIIFLKYDQGSRVLLTLFKTLIKQLNLLLIVSLMCSLNHCPLLY